MFSLRAPWSPRAATISRSVDRGRGRGTLHALLRIAHVSDLHVLSPAGTELRRVLFNKRATGYANLLLRRGRVYRREWLHAVMEAAAARADQLVVTGDITNLSLEGEYEEARRLLDVAARSAEVTVVPGNHDVYLPAVFHERRFSHHFSPFMESDLPELALDLPSGRFPFVKLRGPIAILGLSSAVPRPPFISAGYIGHNQLEALRAVLDHPEVRRRAKVVLLHHDPIDSRFRIEQLRGGLVDARALRRALAPLSAGLVLFGHLHVRKRYRLRTDAGVLDVVSASGAALDHPEERVRAGFNVYELDDDGRVTTLEAHVIDLSGGGFRRTDVTVSRARA